MNYILETERLALREFTTDDAKFIPRLLNSPGWLEFIGDRNVHTEEDAVNYLINGPIKSYNENGFGLSMVEIKADNTPIGMCGILKRPHLDNTDIGFAFLPEFTGKGYAFEIANALMSYAKDVLNIPVILAITTPTNVRSIKLLEKIGLKFVRTTIYPDDNEELFLFSNQQEIS